LDYVELQSPLDFTLFGGGLLPLRFQKGEVDLPIEEVLLVFLNVVDVLAKLYCEALPDVVDGFLLLLGCLL
jgi:hypothetical protein